MKTEDFIEDAKEDLGVSQNRYNLLEENGTVVCEPPPYGVDLGQNKN